MLDEKIWREGIGDPEKARRLVRSLNVSPIMADLLVKRGLDTPEKASAFMKPTLKDLHDPFLFPEMDKAVGRIRRALKNKERITVYGDYDVDGITSISVMLHYFDHIGCKADYYIPDREDEGYGLNAEAIENIYQKGCDLLITVDCGITSVEEAERCKELGIDLIVTDHHEPQETLPDCVAIVNPKVGNYPFRMLAGVGVALKLVHALLGNDHFFSTIDTYIGITALGTVADIAPLVDENRIIVARGLEELNRRRHIGLYELYQVSGLEKQRIEASHIAFNLGPRINATGRINEPQIGVKLLMTRSQSEAIALAQKMNAMNDERRAIEEAIFNEALDYIDKHVDLATERMIIVQGRNWHHGVIGIVASRLTQRFHRPSMVLNLEDDGIAKGSARSIDDLNLFEILSRYKKFFLKFGGHEMAAGLSMTAENVAPFVRAVNEELSTYDESCFYRKVVYDLTVDARALHFDFLDEMNRLEPFGVKNPRPLLHFKQMKVAQRRAVGKQRDHLKLTLVKDGRSLDAIGFRMIDEDFPISEGEVLDLVGHLERNEYNGTVTLQLLVRDLRRPSEDHLPFTKKGIFFSLDQGRMVLANHGRADWRYAHPEERTPHLCIFTLEGYRDVIEGKLEEERILLLPTLKELSRFAPEALSFYDRPFDTRYLVYEKEPLTRYMEPAEHFMPNREELLDIYRIEVGTTGIDDLVKQLGLTAAKILIGLDLLGRLSLLTYELDGHLITVKEKHRPKKKIDLEHTAVHRRYAEILNQ